MAWAPTAAALTPTVNVATAQQLAAALASATAGTTIVLASGTYIGTFTTRVNGSSTAPITLTGPRTAILSSGSVSAGAAFTASHDYWNLTGFGVSTSQRGIVLLDADSTIITGVEIASTGQQGISVLKGSRDVVIRGSIVRDTGVTDATRGDGIAVGTRYAEWKSITGSTTTPDRSDRVISDGNSIRDTSGEGIEIREGTRDAQIRGNVFTRSGFAGGSVADSWVDIMGDNSIVENNSGSVAVLDAFQVHSVIGGWGGGNVFRNNTVTAIPGYEVRIESTESGNSVTCEPTGAVLGISNAPCVGSTTTPTPSPTPTATPTPTPTPTTTTTTSIRVSTAAQLTTALAAARPGQTIALATGTYTGKFVAAANGTSTAPITLTGPSTAVLTTGSTGSGYGLHITGDRWIVSGLSVTTAQKGIMLDSSSFTVIDGVTVSNTGHEAVHVRSNSVGVIIRNSTIHHAGVTNVDYGEGVYVGTAKSNWSSIMGSSSTPDRSDRVLIENNRISDTTAEGIDIKEGTTGGVIRGNVFLRVANSGGAYADSWVDLKGNGYVIEANSGSITGLDAFQTHSVLAGWGASNTFRNNTVISGVPGYEVRVDTGGSGNRVICKTSTAKLGLTNVPCT